MATQIRRMENSMLNNILSTGQIFVPYNGKIADITEADTNRHTLDLATALNETRKIVAVNVSGTRITGTGYFHVYPNEGTHYFELGVWNTYPRGYCAIANGTQRLQYKLSVANDDYDIYCFGYVVEA